MLNQNEADALIEQMGDYPLPASGDKVHLCLSDDVREKKLYQGVSVASTTDPLLHRKAFIQYLTKHSPHPPGKSAYTMTEFLGKEGLGLYKNALAEEVNSRAYRDALFNHSIRHYEGNALCRRVIIPFAGASATGKTHASSAVMDSICQQVGMTEEPIGNDVLVVDGAIARATSQVRDLLVRVATNKGCQQLNDLQKNSKVLEKAKQSIQNVGFASSMHLMLIETFTAYGLSSGFGISFSSIMKNIAQRKDAAVVFCRVKGYGVDVDDKKEGRRRFQQFRSLINKMGERRAWGQNEPTKVSLDLSKSEKLPEFKAYVPQGFIYGDAGSKQAENWVKNNVPGAIIFHVINDLYAYKKTDSNTWVEADDADQDVFICSKRVYDAWLTQTEALSLPEYNDRYAHEFKPLIFQQNNVPTTVSLRDDSRRSNTPDSTATPADNFSQSDLDELSELSVSSAETENQSPLLSTTVEEETLISDADDTFSQGERDSLSIASDLSSEPEEPSKLPASASGGWFGFFGLSAPKKDNKVLPKHGKENEVDPATPSSKHSAGSHGSKS